MRINECIIIYVVVMLRILLFFVNLILPCVSPCLVLRAEKRSCGVVETPATFGFEAETAQLPTSPPPPPPPRHCPT